ncbi:hypothetical protein PV04_01886 [Phialophora macrospora]|uniref:Uncharacterized protein n=1 Tax=Phialophora macrospora TaxID=1851006 RepID=A0A0D2D881_9EURO|nr:hypothetical protein PV04_01886 [Phialophora macrospora]
MPCVGRCRPHCLAPVLKLRSRPASAFVLSTRAVSFPLDAMVPCSHPHHSTFSSSDRSGHHSDPGIVHFRGTTRSYPAIFYARRNGDPAHDQRSLFMVLPVGS